MPDAAAAFLCERGVPTLWGWLPNSSNNDSRLQLEDLADEITMVKLLTDEARLTDNERFSAMHFREIDRV
jgi:hypothetical protein